MCSCQEGKLASVLTSSFSSILKCVKKKFKTWQEVIGSGFLIKNVLCLYINSCLQPPFTVIHVGFLAVLQVHQKQWQPAGRSECFLALMRPECAWSMSTAGLTAQEICFPRESPFLRGSYCHGMARSKPSWTYRHELDK